MTYVGQSVRRFEDPRLVTGKGSFVDDLKMPGLLHAAVLRSMHAHARLRSVDTTAARDLPGVLTVTTNPEMVNISWNKAEKSSGAISTMVVPCWPGVTASSLSLKL